MKNIYSLSFLCLTIFSFIATLNAQPLAGPFWNTSIELRDYMKRFVFQEELISYEIEFPGTFPARHLKLTRENQSLDYQLGNVSTDHQGNLKQARVYFRTGLNMGQSHTFVLSYDPGYTAHFKDLATLTSVDVSGRTAFLHTNYQQVQVPYGNWSPNVPFSEVPAPILKISHRPDDWVGPGRLFGDLKVERISAIPIEDGNLFLKYRIIYWLEGGRKYQVDLTVRHNEKYVTIDELLENISPEDKLAFRFSYTQGVDPDARLIISNHGYNQDERWPWSGHYAKDLNRESSMPFQLGQWSPHSATATHAALFWNDSPEVENAIIFSVYRIEEWKTHLRYIWNSGDAAENLYFYQNDGEKYMQAGLAGTQRHWAISIIHENDENPITIESQDGSRRFYWKANRDLKGLDTNKRTQKGGGPEIRLAQKLTDFSLDWVKDINFVWDEDLDASFENPLHGKEDEMTYKQYLKGNGIAGSNNFEFVERSGASYLGGAQTLGRGQPEWLFDYALSRKNWTTEQRQEVRAILIHWISSLMFHDGIHPHISMISGHPNFIIETLFAGIYCKIFPNHPDAPKWKESFLKMWDEYLTVYLRHADPDHYALSGRHTENITCYSRASLRGLLENIKGFREYDGTDLTLHPRFKEWVRWHLYALVTAAPWNQDDFHTYTPPQGAHAYEVERPNHSEWRDLFFQLVEEIRPGNPMLADNFLWALTRGTHGLRPNLESALFADYGAILRYDFGGPNEAYLNIQQINSWSGTWNGYRLSGSMNYRWGDRGNGSVYYAAQDKIWSWNTPEANGDNFDINALPVFKVGNAGLLGHKTDGVLYNFGAVQFYRANGSSPDYHSRDVMMVRNDYIAIYDNVKEGVKGEFLWANPYWDMPVIHPVTEGPVDNLHIVEPRTNPVFNTEKTPYGSVLRKKGTTEYVFMSDRNQSIEQKDISFQGRSAYARNGLLAIFEGSFLRLEDLSLEITGEGFGASAVIEADGSIRGRISGNGYGEFILTLPKGMKTSNRSVYINGEKIIHDTKGQRIMFNCQISVMDGYYSTYDIISTGGIPTPEPKHPILSIGKKEQQLPAVWSSFKVVKNYNDDFADLKAHRVGSVHVSKASSEVLEEARKHGMKLTISPEEITERAFEIPQDIGLFIIVLFISSGNVYPKKGTTQKANMDFEDRKQCAPALEKEPSIAGKVRIVWLGSNYPKPGEYNQDNDISSMNYILSMNVPFEIVTVRYGAPSGTDAVRATPEEIKRLMPGKGPRISEPVIGRHDGEFYNFGDYSVNLFEHIQLHGNPPSRALFDMAAVAIVKNAAWASQKIVPAPVYSDKKWVEQPGNERKITIWENFNRDSIMKDFYSTMENYVLVKP